MIITLKKNIPQAEMDRLISSFEEKGLRINLSHGDMYTVLGLVGDTTGLYERDIQANEWVENVQRVQAPYKLANRLFHPEDTIVDVGGIKIGNGQKLAIMAGPCSVESEESINEIAAEVRKAGADILRGGAYKPRTS
ncbi:MAG: 3-deoxy-7-phosphoheptulonate synthase, partial [Erysipelotrichaceae bacterium]|nr:3-deoxy-7-phosphoheptulonate synthase [Erysipelotrichaceae bacterium]